MKAIKKLKLLIGFYLGALVVLLLSVITIPIVIQHGLSLTRKFIIEEEIIETALIAILFLVITAPVAAHMIGRTAYKSRVPLWEGSTVDEWDGEVPPRGDRSPTQHERNET